MDNGSEKKKRAPTFIPIGKRIAALGEKKIKHEKNISDINSKTTEIRLPYENIMTI